MKWPLDHRYMFRAIAELRYSKMAHAPCWNIHKIYFYSKLEELTQNGAGYSRIALLQAGIAFLS